MEYLVTMTTQVPEGTAEATEEDVRVREAARSRTLAAQGHLLRLWRPTLPPGEIAADGRRQLDKALASMRLHVWRTDEIAPLSPHPNDPAPTANPDRSETQHAVSRFVHVYHGPASTFHSCPSRALVRAVLLEVSSRPTLRGGFRSEGGVVSRTARRM
jgi:muconolactone D-isomerase